MDMLIYIIKYGALVVIGINAVLVGRAMISMVLEKARAAEPAPAQE